MKVHLFVPCLVDQVLPAVGEATVRILNRVGCDVVYDRRQTCCGQPAYNAGYRDEARAAARHFLRVFGDAEAIVAPSGSCVAMVRSFYRELLVDLPEEDQLRFDRLRRRIFELCELLVDFLEVTDLGARLSMTATYHDSCHLLRELNVDAAPRRLLQAVEGLELVPLPESDRCCGFGGTFSMKHPELSVAMGEAKARRILETGASTVISADTGCLLQVRGILERQKVPVDVMHIAEVLSSFSTRKGVV